MATHYDLDGVLGHCAMIIKPLLGRPSYIYDDSVRENDWSHIDSQLPGNLTLNFGFPTPMNELQERFLTDFVFLWRSYIDDPLAWTYSSKNFRVFSIAFLRLAAWDFEVSLSSNTYIPMYIASTPRWHHPSKDIYWFHGFLVVLQEDIKSEAMVKRALMRGKLFVGDKHGNRTIHLILISPRQVAFVQLSVDVLRVSKRMALLSNHSAKQCSPDFRALTRILTSDCWRSYPRQERWRRALPP